MSEKLIITESMHGGFTVDRDKRIVQNVCLLSPNSKNGYSYSSKAIQEATPKYDGKPVYLDHAENPSKRSIRALAGRVVNPRIVEGKPYGDVKARRGSAGDEFLNIAEDQLEDATFTGVGMSHVVQGRKSKDGRIVESIEKVISIDLVTGPATTTNLRESEDEQVELQEKLKGVLAGKKPVLDRLKEVCEALNVEFVEADQELPVQLVIESVDELREYAKGKPALERFVKDYEAIQRKQWLSEAIAESKVPDTEANRKLIAKFATKEEMLETAKSLKESLDSVVPDKPRIPGRNGKTDLTVDELIRSVSKK